MTISRTRISLFVAAIWLAGCGGGSSEAPGPAALPPLALPAGPISESSPVVAGCTGGAVSGTVYANAEVEPFAAVHSHNPSLWIAAWQQDRWSSGGARAMVVGVSKDAGASWRRTLMPFSRCGGAVAGSSGDFERVSDPWVDVGPTGILYAMGLAFSGESLSRGSASAMLASRSIDAGQTWSTPVTLQRDGETLFNDKNALTADPTDPRYVYAVWDRLDAADFGPTLLARSTDSGATWEPARIIYSPAVPNGSRGVSQTLGNRVVVLKDGTVLNVFTQIDTVGSQASTWLGILRSSDKGLTWSAPLRVADLQAVGVKDPQTGQALRTGAVLSSVAVGSGNDVWLTWQDARASNGLRDAIVVSRSRDGGLHWTEPVPINTQSRVAAFTPSVTVSADGLVGISHYDLRADTADRSTLLAGAWLLTSRDGTSWTETPIWSPFDMARAPDSRGLFLGDYQGLIAVGTGFVPVLALAGTDASNRTDVYALRVNPSTTNAASKAGDTAAVHTPELGLSPPAFAQARHAAIVETMERRIPGWWRRMPDTASR
jgi:hypothetical protein